MLAKANPRAPTPRDEFVPALAFRAHFPQHRVDPSGTRAFVLPADGGAALQAFSPEPEETPPQSGPAVVVPLPSPAVIVERYGPYLERLLGRMVGWDPELPDLLQDVFLQAFQCLGDLKNPAALKGWLGRIAIFTARAWIRKRRLRRGWLRILAPEELPETNAVTPEPEIIEALQHTHAVLDALPADERLAFMLRFVDGMKLREVARVCGVSLSTVKRTLLRAEKRFLAVTRRDPLLYDRLKASRRWRMTSASSIHGASLASKRSAELYSATS
jgi:RNA polymerase sigma-70 factor (ECF subfamily)